MPPLILLVPLPLLLLLLLEEEEDDDDDEDEAVGPGLVVTQVTLMPAPCAGRRTAKVLVVTGRAHTCIEPSAHPAKIFVPSNE